jgi:hypothetical protein
LDRALDHPPTNFRLTAKNQVRSRVVEWLRIWDRQQSAFHLLGEAIKVAARTALQTRSQKLALIKRIIGKTLHCLKRLGQLAIPHQ